MKLNKSGHANFCKRFMFGLPGSLTEADSSRVAIGFYCVGALDIIGMLQSKTKESERDGWREWIWEQQVRRQLPMVGADFIVSSETYVLGGFRPGPFLHIGHDEDEASTSPSERNAHDSLRSTSIDPPHLIMTYTALLSLAILRDDFSRLDRAGLRGLLRITQRDDGSFTAIPGFGESDVRMVYTAFSICSMLDDWSSVDVEKAIGFVKRCFSYEGGFGQAPDNEATGGPTYCALASLHLVPPQFATQARLTDEQRRRTVRWLVQNQCALGAKDGGEGGFRGRTEKAGDACYSFWCGAALEILGEGTLVQRVSNTHFLYRCQAGIGGIAKAPDEHPDPYHTYLALASLALYPPAADRPEFDESWKLPRFDSLLNATEETARWARERIPDRPIPRVEES